MFEDLLIPLIVVGLAEFGDKTQLSLFILSSKTNKHLMLLSGAIFAFAIVDGIAILFGDWVVHVVPLFYVKIFSGIIFIVFGILTIMNKNDEGKEKYYFKNPFLLSFTLIFLTEWGDKTQIAAALFAARYNGILVFAGVMIALCILSIIAIYLGKIISERVDRRLVSWIAGIVFIIIGITFFLF
jgi:putative Ca2+/H+ antiporter (TMEM165/GDT1 family)